MALNIVKPLDGAIDVPYSVDAQRGDEFNSRLIFGITDGSDINKVSIRVFKVVNSTETKLDNCTAADTYAVINGVVQGNWTFFFLSPYYYLRHTHWDWDPNTEIFVEVFYDGIKIHASPWNFLTQNALSPLFISSTFGTVENNGSPSWTWQTNGAGNQTYRYWFVEGNYISEGTTNTTYTASGLSDGDYTLYVQEGSEEGIWSQVASRMEMVDLAAPSAPIVVIDPMFSNPTNSTIVGWIWTSGGGGDGTGFRYSLNASGPWTTTNNLYYIATLPEGEHTLYVQERDFVGNWSESGSATITIDTTLPSAPNINIVHSTDNTSATWTWSSTAADGSGIFRYGYVVGTWLNGTNGSAEVEFSKTNISSDVETILYVQEKDLAGNWSASAVAQMKPLAPTFFTPATTPIGNKKPYWSWNSSLAGNGNYRYKLNDSNLESGATLSAIKYFVPSANLPYYQDHTLYLQERNLLGEWSDVVSKTISIEPEILSFQEQDTIVVSSFSGTQTIVLNNNYIYSGAGVTGPIYVHDKTTKQLLATRSGTLGDKVQVFGEYLYAASTSFGSSPVIRKFSLADPVNIVLEETLAFQYNGNNINVHDFNIKANEIQMIGSYGIENYAIFTFAPTNLTTPTSVIGLNQHVEPNSSYSIIKAWWFDAGIFVTFQTGSVNTTLKFDYSGVKQGQLDDYYALEYFNNFFYCFKTNGMLYKTSTSFETPVITQIGISNTNLFFKRVKATTDYLFFNKIEENSSRIEIYNKDEELVDMLGLNSTSPVQLYSGSVDSLTQHYYATTTNTMYEWKPYIGGESIDEETSIIFTTITLGNSEMPAKINAPVTIESGGVLILNRSTSALVEINSTILVKSGGTIVIPGGLDTIKGPSQPITIFPGGKYNIGGGTKTVKPGTKLVIKKTR